jgi:hypothetical protein
MRGGLVVSPPATAVVVPLVAGGLAGRIPLVHFRAPDLAGRNVSASVAARCVRRWPVTMRVHHAPAGQRSGQHQGQQKFPFVSHMGKSPRSRAAAHAPE